MKNITNQIIIAMPHMSDDRFKKSVVLIFEHNSQGATGLIINKQIDKKMSLDIIDGINQNIDNKINNKTPIYYGGPLSPDRGIVIHDNKALSNDSIEIDGELFLTSHIDSIIKAQSIDKCNYKFMLGYSGWTSKQLDSEIENGDWIMQEANSDLIFNKREGEVWQLAINSFGVEISDISSQGGIS
jgi:putative transcriptional regulator